MTTLYILAPFLVILAFLVIRRYRNASSETSTSDIKIQKQTNSCLNEHFPTFERAKCESKAENVISPKSDFSIQPSCKPSLCRIDPQLPAHRNATSQFDTFSFQHPPIHQSGNVHSTLPLTSGILNPVANGQQPFMMAEPYIQGLQEVQNHQNSALQHPMAGHPQLRSETVQIFHGMGIEKGRAWKRKILEFR